MLPQMLKGLCIKATHGSYPRIEQRLCQEVGSSADEFSLEVPATDAPLGFVPGAGHNITPCLLLMPADQGQLEAATCSA